MEILGIIPARGGSKGIKRKNLKEILGKPLVAYSIEAGINSKLVTKVVVSTEDSEIKEISLKYGAEVIDRPIELAKDETKVKELQSVMSHLVNVLYIAGVLLQPVLTHSPKALFAQLGVKEEYQNYESIRNFGIIGDVDVTKGSPLFPRLDASVEVEFIASLMQKK